MKKLNYLLPNFNRNFKIQPIYNMKSMTFVIKFTILFTIVITPFFINSQPTPCPNGKPRTVTIIEGLNYPAVLITSDGYLEQFSLGTNQAGNRIWAAGTYPSYNCRPLQTEFVGKFGFDLPHQWLGQIDKVKAKLKIFRKNHNTNQWEEVTESNEQEFSPGVSIEYSVKCITNVEENAHYKGEIYYKVHRTGKFGSAWEISWNKLETNRLNIYCCESDIIRRPKQWQVSYCQASSCSSWNKIASSGYYLNELAFGDFNGDGLTDIFHPTGSIWEVSYMQKSGTVSNWTKIATSAYVLKDISFGDFNGDGLTDIFHPTGSKWEVSYMQNSGTVSNWTYIATSGYGLKDLSFGDFNRDGLTDIFHPTGSKWEVSYMQNSGTVSNWTYIATSGYGLNDISFGDFNGDGLTDIFHPTGSKWEVSYMQNSGTVSNWTYIATSGYGLNDISFGDFNGDGLTDIFHPTGSKWEVSYMQNSGTVSNWTTISNSDKSLETLSIGRFRTKIHPYFLNTSNNKYMFTYLDFNGDKKTDFVIATQ